MIETPELVIEHVSLMRGSGEPLVDIVRKAIAADTSLSTMGLKAVLAATFSGERRFPSLAVQAAAELGLPPDTPAFDIQMACSAYPYALYLAGKLAADTGGRVLIVDGDVQSRLVDRNDHATGAIFSDAVTLTVVSADGNSSARSYFDFLSHYDDSALSCAEAGPIRMDGFKVFTFVATEVLKFLRSFVAEAGARGREDMVYDRFVPHQANAYMVRQLAKSLGCEDRLATLDEGELNPGSCSIPMTIATKGVTGRRVLVAGFGAGYSAGAAIVRVGG